MQISAFLGQATAITHFVWGAVSPVIFGPTEAPLNQGSMGMLTFFGIFGGFLILSVLLTKVWIGIVNVSLIDVESLASIERRQPYLPSFRVILLGLAGTALLALVSLRTMSAISLFAGPGGHERAAFVLGSLFAVMGLILLVWKGSKEYIFACVSGTVMSFILIAFTSALLAAQERQDPFIITLSIVAIVLVWRFLFGPWDAKVKAMVLATFVFWIAVHLVFQETPSEQIAHVISMLIAAVPAVIWCALFLRYHRERLSVVCLMFFSGMVSTAPILFYDALVKKGIELQFFVFRIVPESFNVTVHSAISKATDAPPLQVTLIAVFLTFVFVGLLEEGSKFWVLKRNGRAFVTSIDDAMQLGIMVAIGFAFAENITSTGYFFSFVKDFLQASGPVDWAGFLGNIMGRSVLTSMVHIVSTGIMGYFFGVALFLDPNVRQSQEGGRTFLSPDGSHFLVGIQKEDHFRGQMMAIGLLAATLLHALSNFLVTLPDVLPGNPRTFGELFHLPPSSPLHYIALLLIPSLLYVVGGFWVLSSLFLNKKNAQERGHLVATELMVVGE